MTDSPLFAGLYPVVEALEKAGIRYSVSGSLASSFYGLARSTQDVDIVAEVRLHHVGALVKQLQTSFYIDPDAIEEAIRRGSSFNIIHLETLTKVDVFVAASGSLDDETLRRSKRKVLDETGSGKGICISSPEDIVLNKLKWYNDGGRISGRQWRDVLGILKVQKGLLDVAYMQEWARRMGLSELLQAALHDYDDQRAQNPKS